MFETVGRNNDVEAARRGLAAGVGTAGLAGLAVGLVALAGWVAGRQLVQDVAPVDETMVVVMQEDPSLDAAALPPPPPPPAAGPAEPSPTEAPIPDELRDAVAELDDAVPDEVTSEAGGDPEAGVTGIPHGVLGGVLGGVIGSTGDGPPLGGPTTVHHSEVRVKRRTALGYPEAAYDLGLGRVTCRVRVFIDESGVPRDVRSAVCPPVFRDALERGLSRWRWYPARVEGTPVEAQFLLSVQFIP